METKHLFFDELEFLERNPIEGNFKLLIVGTFNPAIRGNNAEWYYDRIENEFWFLLPKMLNQKSLHELDIDLSKGELTNARRRFISENKIVIVDLFKKVNVKLYNKSDKALSALSKQQVVLFNFRKAFEKCSFEKILFTRKTISKTQYNSTKECRIGISIHEYKEHFIRSKFMAVESPSPTNAKGRYEKLINWKENYFN